MDMNKSCVFCYDENIIICIDEFGRLQILNFGNVEDLLEAIKRLKNAKFAEGFSVPFNPVFERKNEKNENSFNLARISKRSKKQS